MFGAVSRLLEDLPTRTSKATKLIDVHALRSLAGTDIVAKLTQHRLWITLDYAQLHVFQTMGFTAPNIRAYQLYEHIVEVYIWNRFPYNQVWVIIWTYRAIDDLFPPQLGDSDPGRPPDNDFNTSHFWNLNFHDRNEEHIPLTL